MNATLFLRSLLFHLKIDFRNTKHGTPFRSKFEHTGMSILYYLRPLDVETRGNNLWTYFSQTYIGLLHTFKFKWWHKATAGERTFTVYVSVRCVNRKNTLSTLLDSYIWIVTPGWSSLSSLLKWGIWNDDMSHIKYRHR